MLQPVGKLTPVKARQEEFRQTPIKPVGKLTLISPPDPEVVVEEVLPTTESAPDARQLQDLEDSLAREDAELAALSKTEQPTGTLAEDSLPIDPDSISKEVEAQINSQLFGKTSAHLLQEDLGVTADGILGKGTLAAAKKRWGEDAEVIVEGVKAQQRTEFKDATTKLSQEIAPLVGEGIDPKWIQSIWLHESASGNKVLGSTFNLGNLKARGTQAFKTFNVWEHLGGQDVTVPAKFRVFKSFKEAALGWKDFVSSDRYKDAREASTFEDFISELKRAGYATDPRWEDGVRAAYEAL